MSHAWSVRLLTIPDAEASVVRRGFVCPDPGARVHLETIGTMFLRGYRAALGERRPQALADILDDTPQATRGFAYEGAGMALALLDLLFPWRRRLRALLLDRGQRHRYMLHVGAGWACARLHRRIAPWIENEPLLGWLAVDGFGFHEGYFHPEKYVTAGIQPRRAHGYAARAFDQGLGRSLWFVSGADPERALRSIARFSPDRHADLWSGLGLAATYAGGASRDALSALRSDAGTRLPWLAQGAAFAAAARVEAQNLTADTTAACETFCECDPVTAASVVALVRDRLPETNDYPPPYELWRRGIATALAAAKA